MIDPKMVIESNLMVVKFQLTLLTIRENDPAKISQIDIAIDDINRIIDLIEKL
ncbi:hypothetical protein PN480_03320 [Dolichospermum circinale CS-1225]|uniref:Uncharacterized protein n=1 Tax=Dolichospermum circinale CS-537/01 TaxID=3021739 RepID=A0ABT5A6I3_9CYAN|nr:hypothetical protein [Dolichospermum circinale]MDB9466572.1 hypothetical protein [Dolichospermum circinale CS-539/09]MDB9471989.1 hypothetical protein [Dolichospermum circinale CS-539]MDB9487546.1 hypothetical protein [Dolichospermum circinale CS-537/01]MDB9520986.1 hypothetical protein [Dolichospermum circinale CS-1225]